MVTALTILIAINCILLVLVILVQNPKGGGIDSTFGGAGASQILGAAQSTDFIEKLTWILAGTLFFLCILTSLLVTGNAGGAEDLTL